MCLCAYEGVHAKSRAHTHALAHSLIYPPTHSLTYTHARTHTTYSGWRGKLSLWCGARTRMMRWWAPSRHPRHRPSNSSIRNQRVAHTHSLTHPSIHPLTPSLRHSLTPSHTDARAHTHTHVRGWRGKLSLWCGARTKLMRWWAQSPRPRLRHSNSSIRNQRVAHTHARTHPSIHPLTLSLRHSVTPSHTNARAHAHTHAQWVEREVEPMVRRKNQDDEVVGPKPPSEAPTFQLVDKKSTR